MESGSARRFSVEIEEALGPGLDYAHDLDRGIHVTGIRPGGLWLGVDRGVLVDSDDGRGRRVPVLVALPSSSFVGARMDVELTGGFRGGHDLLIGRLPGASVPIDPALRSVGRLDDDASRIDAAAAARIATAARRRFRERRGRGRITGGRAWLPPEELSSLRASAAIYSAAERALDKLPPRYRRALDGLLDPDERLHVSVRRPWRLDTGLKDRFRRTDRRSGLLLLTDRQILWIVDHFNPDSLLSDWGVDIALLPVERLRRVVVESGRGDLRLAFEAEGRLGLSLPFELEAEASVLASRARRFVPDENRQRLRRRYDTTPVEFAEDAAARFGQLDDARSMLATARREADVLGFLYSPRREGQLRPLGLWLSPVEVGLVGSKDARRRVGLASLTDVQMSLSPLSAAVTVRSAEASIQFPYPGPLGAHAAAFIKLLRRCWANATE